MIYVVYRKELRRRLADAIDVRIIATCNKTFRVMTCHDVLSKHLVYIDVVNLSSCGTIYFLLTVYAVNF